MKRSFFLLGFIAVIQAQAGSAPLVIQSAAEQTALMELYTSEGCSSCPPAETWVSGLKESPGLWKRFVPVAFHVDYWDYLGWPDRWASAANSDRQRAYAALWHGETIYTPGFVVNGAEWRDWAQQKNGPKSTGAKIGVLSASSADTNHWRVSFAPATANRENYEAHAALLAGGLSSAVNAGENRGRLLKHDFVVVSLVAAPLVHDGDSVRGDLSLPLPAQRRGETLALAVWVTKPSSLVSVQATGGWLRQPISGR